MRPTRGWIVAASFPVATFCLIGMEAPASAQDDATPAGQEATTPAEENAVAENAAADPDAAQTEALPDEDAASGTEILSADTISILLDARLVGADGHLSWVEGGLSKSRFHGTSDGDFRIQPLPVEAAFIWQPRFSSSLAGNVSVAWQLDQDNPVDLLEAYLSFLPRRGEGTGFSVKAGLYWPEISLEHATGGVWSTVNTITPSAINSWVGEEVKVIGLEATIMQPIGDHEIWATGGIFGWNDTSGTLLSFRGWALHDMKATAFGYFELPPLNDFIVHLQEGRTESLLEIDDRPGFYGRLEWRPPWPFTINAFYYDNRGDPEVFTPEGQWGWRTKFWNIGIAADLGTRTRLLAQGMWGNTKMGFTQQRTGLIWVDTDFRSAFVLVTHEIGEWAVTGRVEAFETEEHGGQMSPLESEDGWAVTLAGRLAISPQATFFLEAMHIQSDRGVRVTNFGIPAEENQTVLQASIRMRL